MGIHASRRASGSIRPLVFTLEADEYRSQPIPGLPHTRIGSCFARVTDLPDELGQYMQVNPRVPSKTARGILKGPVIAGIQHTLRSEPETMALRNQGLYLAVDDASWERAKGGTGLLTVKLTDPQRHGIVNGGHTFAAIRDTVDEASDDELAAIRNGFVRLHLYQGIDQGAIVDMAEGLNRSKQVDDPSLENLKGTFEPIKRQLLGTPAQDSVAYYQGDDGPVYISEILVYMEMFNCSRFDDMRHPAGLYAQRGSVIRLFEQDWEPADGSPSPMKLILPQLYEILELSDRIRKATPDAARALDFELPRAKVVDKRQNNRAGSPPYKKTPLLFMGGHMGYRIPNGWVFPMLAAFRANVDWDLDGELFRWRVPIAELLPAVAKDLLAVCITAHKERMVPELVGKSTMCYRQCYSEVRHRVDTMAR